MNWFQRWTRWRRHRRVRWAMTQYRNGNRAPLLAICDAVPHVNQALFDRLAAIRQEYTSR